jgi:hypothetical protein
MSIPVEWFAVALVSIGLLVWYIQMRGKELKHSQKECHALKSTVEKLLFAMAEEALNAFTPPIDSDFAAYGPWVTRTRVVPRDAIAYTIAIRLAKNAGADILTLTIFAKVSGENCIVVPKIVLMVIGPDNRLHEEYSGHELLEAVERGKSHLAAAQKLIAALR